MGFLKYFLILLVLPVLGKANDNCMDSIKTVCGSLKANECIQKKAAKLPPKCMAKLAMEATKDHPQMKCFREISKVCQNGAEPDCVKKGIKNGKIPSDCDMKMDLALIGNQTPGMSDQIPRVGKGQLGKCVQELNKLCPIDAEQLVKDGHEKYMLLHRNCIKVNTSKMSKTCRDFLDGNLSQKK